VKKQEQTASSKKTLMRRSDEGENLKQRESMMARKGSGPKPPRDVTESVDDLEYGVATEMWRELKPHPDGTAKSLWLLVDGAWLRLDDYEEVWDSVQAAFCNCPDNLEVLVWYKKDNPDPDYHPGSTDPDESESKLWYGTCIEGLVIRSK
jgi:hypothetical protein